MKRDFLSRIERKVLKNNLVLVHSSDTNYFGFMRDVGLYWEIDGPGTNRTTIYHYRGSGRPVDWLFDDYFNRTWGIDECVKNVLENYQIESEKIIG